MIAVLSKSEIKRALRINLGARERKTRRRKSFAPSERIGPIQLAYLSLPVGAVLGLHRASLAR
jgi:hypothetical protein